MDACGVRTMSCSILFLPSSSSNSSSTEHVNDSQCAVCFPDVVVNPIECRMQNGLLCNACVNYTTLMANISGLRISLHKMSMDYHTLSNALLGLSSEDDSYHPRELCKWGKSHDILRGVVQWQDVCIEGHASPCCTCKPCTLRDDIQRKLAVTQAFLAEYGLTIDQVNAVHDPFLRSRLPLEITSMILQRAILDFRKIHQEDESITTPLTLSAVCRNWRTITQGIPQLWTHIHLNVSFKIQSQSAWRSSAMSRRSRTKLELLHEWLARAGTTLALSLNCMLYVVQDGPLYDENSAHPPTHHDVAVEFGPFVDTINSYAHRWEKMSIMSYQRILSDLATSYGTESAQRLRVLGLCSLNGKDMFQQLDREGSYNEAETERFSEAIKTSSTDSPSPFYFVTKNYRLKLVNIDWTNRVTHLAASVIDLWSCISTLACAPHVVEFRVSAYTYIPRQSEKIVHHALRRLYIDDNNMQGIWWINTLTLPGLEHLTIRLHSTLRITENEWIISLVQRSGCKIKSLELSGDALGWMGTHCLVHLLFNLPQLEVLNIKRLQFDSEILRQIVDSRPSSAESSSDTSNKLPPNLRIFIEDEV